MGGYLHITLYLQLSIHPLILFTMRNKKLLIIYSGILTFIFGLYNGPVFSQNNSNNEQIETILAHWKNLRRDLKQKLILDKKDMAEFCSFYEASLDSDRGAFNQLVWKEQLNINNVDNYIYGIENKYVAKYGQFLSIKKENPSLISSRINKPKSTQATCTTGANIDFESGTLNGWNAYYGENSSTTTSFSILNITGGAAGAVTEAALDSKVGNTYQVKIMSGGTDAITGLPRVSPTGGNYSVRLGDSTNPDFGFAMLTQTFLVTAQNAAFTYQYALLLENPAHPYYQQPFFSVVFLDQNDDTIKCNSQFDVSGTTQLGFKAVYYATNGDSVYYTNWKSVLAPLTSYIGQCVTVQFRVSDCALGAHFGYAYIDASTSAMTITPSAPAICGSPATLTAPSGAASYNWTGPCISGSSNTQTATVSCSGNYKVVMTRYFGSCTDTISINEPGTLTSPSFVADTACLGSATQFSNTSNPSSGAGIKFYWDYYGTGVYNDSVTSPAYTYNSAGTYNVKLTEVVGSCSVTDSSKVIVRPLPTVTITSSPANDTVCSGGKISLSGNGAASYVWSGGITNGVVFSPSSTGKYIVTGTDGLGCKSKDSVTVVTSTKALPTITITSSPANDIVCPGNPVTLSGNGGKTYSWSGGITNATPFTPVSTNKYMVTGTDANGCSNKDSVIVTVDKPSITITASDSIPCIGNSITLSGNGGVSYSWSGGITNAVAFTPSSSGKYIVTGTDANSCSTKDSINIVVDNPIITITSSPINDTVCTGGHITLSGNGGTNYVWSGGITNAVPFSPGTSGKYVVTGTDANGCSNKDSVNVVAGSGALPTITATSSPASDTICKGNTITLSGNGGYSYGWSGGISNAVAFTPSSSGKYIVTGTSANGCSNTDTVNVVVNPLPVIAIIGQTPIISGTKDTLTAKGGVSYVWSTGSTNDTTIVAPTIATKYVVTVTNANGCQDTASFTVTIKTITGISTVTGETGTNLFPNPAKEILNLAFNTNGKTIPAVIRVSDVSGKQWIETNANLDGNRTISIDISRLSAGMYFVRIETNTSVRTIKFIKN